ncbi:hypothetical protein IKD57_01145 [Candidatus Saccharibacteria bacterium]|nr:hypothetical protein [Candidatus Saccharibacteria bacterium]
MAREINLVPDIKGEMIKALKLRNFILFLCIVVASASVVVTAVFASIAGGQQAVVDGKKETLGELSAKLNSYSELSDFLTIKGQLSNLSSINSDKKLLSRTFGILSALLPTNGDTITLSELTVNLEESDPVLSFEAQANATREPYIDYNVLDSFKKSMQYMRYDYGSYVDKNDETIPAYCILESGSDGASFYDSTRGRYAFWLIDGEGCNPSGEGEDALSAKDYTTETYEDNTVVRIWRTPQYNDWYKSEQIEGKPYMSLDGTISGVEHFNSECITYTGALDGDKPVWSETNENCMLVPNGTDGIDVSDSSSGRVSSGDLVLRFSARITLNSEVYDFDKKHVIAIPPTGRHNVTDSYVQIQNMFEKRADDCAENDVTCQSANNGGNNG